MDEARTTRQLSLYRNLALALTFLALMGWGTAYFARASAAVQQHLREEVVQLKATQDQLLAERDQARAQLAAAQQEVMVLTKLLEEIQDKASVTGSVPAPTPASKPPRTPAKTKSKGRSPASPGTGRRPTGRSGRRVPPPLSAARRCAGMRRRRSA